VTVIQRLSEIIDAALWHQLVESYSSNAFVADFRSKISERLATAQLISTRHSELLAAFKSTHTDIEFPALHKELFSQEPGIDTVSQEGGDAVSQEEGCDAVLQEGQ